jgi:hypothetical protein
MHCTLSRTELRKLKERLWRARIASLTAIELGDCRAVARLTCEAARLRRCLSLAESFCDETG